MLMVNREDYRRMIKHRREVCPTFADVQIDEAAIDQFPSEAVPDVLLQSAQPMPETAEMNTTMHGPANRIPMFHRAEKDEHETDNIDGIHLEDTNDPSSAMHAAAADMHADSGNEDELLRSEPLNENETVLGIGEDTCTKPLRLFEAWNANMTKLNAEAAKVAQATLQQRDSGGEDSADAAMRISAAKELVRTTVAVDMIEVARTLAKSNKHRAEVEALVTAQAHNENIAPAQALAVPSGKPLSMFDPSALPSAYTEFLFGDCLFFFVVEVATC